MKGEKKQPAFIAESFKTEIILVSLQANEQIIANVLNADLSSARKIYNFSLSPPNIGMFGISPAPQVIGKLFKELSLFTAKAA